MLRGMSNQQGKDSVLILPRMGSGPKILTEHRMFYFLKIYYGRQTPQPSLLLFHLQYPSMSLSCNCYCLVPGSPCQVHSAFKMCFDCSSSSSFPLHQFLKDFLGAIYISQFILLVNMDLIISYLA